MRRNRTTRTVAAVAAGLGALTLSVTGTATAGSTPRPATVQAATPASRIAVHFDLAKGEMPENIALAPDGTAYVTFAAARQVAMVTPAGARRVLATLAAPADGGVRTPVLNFALTTGIVRTGDGTLYFLYASGDAATTGLYRLRPGGEPRRIAALPATGLPNGLALDTRRRTFYVTDSVLGTISAVPFAGGRAAVWSSAPELAPAGFLGANGIKVHDGAVWATNLDRGTLLRIPLRHSGPGQLRVRATGLAGIDDFAFTGRGDEVLAALNGPSTVVRIGAGGRTTTVLDAGDGLQNPTSLAIRAGLVYVLSAAYTTATDPNLLVAALPRR